MNYYTLLRLEAMDAQRFDPSKRRNSWDFTISIVPPSVHSEESGIPEITTESPESSYSDGTSTTNESSSPTEDSVSSTPTVVEPTIFSHKTDTQSTDVFERDGYTTTRTIIRPGSPRSPLSSIFSRPSSPVPGSTTSRPSSPLGTNFANLNCMGSTDAFEEGLDFILQQREKDLTGITQEIKVNVTQDQTVFYETKWRDAIQAILFERTPPIVSCVGHIH